MADSCGRDVQGTPVKVYDYTWLPRRSWDGPGEALGRTWGGLEGIGEVLKKSRGDNGIVPGRS